MAGKSVYPQIPLQRGVAQGIYLSDRLTDKVVAVRHNLPGTIILIHGVNDVGTSYSAVEAGLCAGLAVRLRGDLTPATYSNPVAADKDKVLDDPDAVFFKRKVSSETHSPVIPFYWGYREDTDFAQAGKLTPHGQATDRYGNRLDKDYSKGGGPFANATSSLPDMWNRGKSGLGGKLDAAQRDATHPIMDNPGHMYMILAARRMAALITMLRDYHEDETVSIVAHSQGCLISLLAQAFLLDPALLKQQANARPADTLILCNPPYSLIDDIPFLTRMSEAYSGSDDKMVKRYPSLDGVQSMHARLTTLVNIVQGVRGKRHDQPPLSDLPDAKLHCGVVGARWAPEQDRDNRGKVYLYFSPEDMTVALSNVQGVGWEGVPEYQRGRKMGLRDEYWTDDSGIERPTGLQFYEKQQIVRKPLTELGDGFFQRVFTAKLRPDYQLGNPVRIGLPPDDFALRVRGEDDQAHTAASDSYVSKHFIRSQLPQTGDAPKAATPTEKARFNLRKITGEALPRPVLADMVGSASRDDKKRTGGSEDVDPIDAAIAVTSDYGLREIWQCIAHPTLDAGPWDVVTPVVCPAIKQYKGMVMDADTQKHTVEAALNRDQPTESQCKVLRMFICMRDGLIPVPLRPTQLLIRRTETAKEGRLRWQHQQVPRSFHGAVFGSELNHRQVTAYDVAIGGGWAPTHPEFYGYLCAVADWRLKKSVKNQYIRPGILNWDEFLASFSPYWNEEPEWRKKIIEGNVDYYSTGKLPDSLPLLQKGAPPAVVSEILQSTQLKAKVRKP